MTRWDLIQEVTQRHPRFSRREAEIMVKTVFESMTEALAQGEGIELRGFGSFNIKHRPTRERRNPKTGELVLVVANKIPFFRVGKELHLRVNRKVSPVEDKA